MIINFMQRNQFASHSDCFIWILTMGNEEQQTQKQGGAQQDASAEAQEPTLTDVFVFYLINLARFKMHWQRCCL